MLDFNPCQECSVFNFFAEKVGPQGFEPWTRGL